VRTAALRNYKRLTQPRGIKPDFMIQNRLGPTKMPYLDKISPSSASYARNTSAKSVHSFEVGQEKSDSSERKTYAYVCDRCMGSIEELKQKPREEWTEEDKSKSRGILNFY
jgi:hypothetical protein